MKSRNRTSVYGGMKRGAGRVYRGATRCVPPSQVWASVSRYTDGTRACPTCRFEVPVRISDQQLVSHRVGPSRREGWPCRGEDGGTP